VQDPVRLTSGLWERHPGPACLSAWNRWITVSHDSTARPGGEVGMHLNPVEMTTPSCIDRRAIETLTARARACHHHCRTRPPDPGPGWTVPFPRQDHYTSLGLERSTPPFRATQSSKRYAHMRRLQWSGVVRDARRNAGTSPQATAPREGRLRPRNSDGPHRTCALFLHCVRA
jgi:hypothetical protein